MARLPLEKPSAPLRYRRGWMGVPWCPPPEYQTSFPSIPGYRRPHAAEVKWNMLRRAARRKAAPQGQGPKEQGAVEGRVTVGVAEPL